LGDPGVDGRIILNGSSRSGMRSMDWTELAQERDRCPTLNKCGNEPWGSIKCREFLDYLRTCKPLKDCAPWSE
jgi:hypothetical protein